MGLRIKCSVEVCDRDTASKNQTLCSMHLKRFLRTGTTNSDRPPRKSKADLPECSAQGCERKIISTYSPSPYCHMHTRRLERTGELREKDPPRVVSFDSVPCSVDTCDLVATSKGMCGIHYSRWYSTGDTRPDEPISWHTRKFGEICLTEGCNKQAIKRYLCGACHARRYRKNEKMPQRRLEPFSAGKSGYELISFNGELMFYHRYVWEQYHNIKLLPQQNIHHINGDRSDNRIENLEIWDTSQPKGQRVADKLRWALEIIGRYCPHKLSGESLWADSVDQDNKGQSSDPLACNLIKGVDYKRGPYKNEHGYMYIYRLDGRKQNLHRAVWEKEYGVVLSKEQNIHHKNGVRDDNRLCNLELWDTSQPSGQRVEDKVSHALLLISRYQPTLVKESEGGQGVDAF